MFNKRQTWIISSLIAVFFVFTAYKLFPKAFPILNINLEMSRDEALSKATELSKIFKIGPENNFQAVTFKVDQKAQNFIELDQGGAEKFIEVLNNKYYEAFSWKVRHYQPDEINEVTFIFT